MLVTSLKSAVEVSGYRFISPPFHSVRFAPSQTARYTPLPLRSAQASHSFLFNLTTHSWTHTYPFPIVMRFSIGLATFTLLFVAAIANAALPDAAAHKRHAAHVNARDAAHPLKKRCKTRPPGYSSSIQPPSPTPSYSASNSLINVSTNNSVPNSGSQNPSVNTASGVINVDPGKCSPIGATSMSRQAFVGRLIDLITDYQPMSQS